MIFLSYRRTDTAGYAFALWRELGRYFGFDAVFFDKDGEHLILGRRWNNGLADAIDKAKACLVVIGPDWLAAKDENGRRRLDLADDPVRNEVARALQRANGGASDAMRVIPVLFGDAAMPAPATLPPDLHDLPALHGQAFEMGLDFEAPFARLADELSKVTGLVRRTGFTAHRQIYHLPSTAVRLFADPLGHLGTLRRMLADRGRAAVLAAASVQGMGGVGKTQLALHYARAHRADYYGVWWFRAENTSLLDQDCAAFCAALKLDVAQGRLHRDVLRDHLASEPRWLLIYDNAEDERPLRDYLPADGPHHVVVTSRRPRWSRAESLRLDVWTDEQALDFLRQRRPRGDDAEHLRLNQALGGLPLALEQACAYLEQTDLSLDDYLTELARLDDADPLLAREDSNDCPRAVAATLTLAYARLSEPARELLHVCAWLAPEPIPEFLFTESAQRLPTALAGVAGSQRRWRETVAELTGSALCQRDEQAGTLSFHRLTLAALRLMRRGGAPTEVEGAIALLRKAFPVDTKLPANWPRCALLAAHVQQAADWQAQSVAANRAVLCWLLDRLADYLANARGLFADAAALQTRALAVAREAQGDAHPGTLTFMNNLAHTLWSHGDLAGALDLQKSALALQRRVLGEEHLDTIGSAWNLFTKAFQLKDSATVQELLGAYLLPLLSRDPGALGADLNAIRQELLDHRDAIARFAGIAFPPLPPAP